MGDDRTAESPMKNIEHQRELMLDGHTAYGLKGDDSTLTTE